MKKRSILSLCLLLAILLCFFTACDGIEIPNKDDGETDSDGSVSGDGASGDSSSSDGTSGGNTSGDSSSSGGSSGDNASDDSSSSGGSSGDSASGDSSSSGGSSGDGTSGDNSSSGGTSGSIFPGGLFPGGSTSGGSTSGGGSSSDDLFDATDDLPTSFGTTQKNYNGKKFTVLTRKDGNSDQAFNIVDLVLNDDLGDEAIRVAVEERNAKIKKYFGVTIKRETVPQGELYDKAKQVTQCMNDQYTVMRLHLDSAINLALGGNLLDLGEQKWIDLDQPWWDEGITESLLLYGGSYFGTGDICTVDDDATWVVLFNKQVLKDRGGMEASQLYQIVKDGDGKTGGWTVDVLKALARCVAREELDSSKKIYDKTYSGDGKYGITVQWAVADALMVSSNYVVLQPDKNDDAFKVKEAGQSALANAVNSVYEFMGGTNASSYWLLMADDLNGTTNNPYADNIRPMFMNDRSCFFICHVGTIGLIRDMETEFGMLPMPKLDDSVYDYGNTVQYDCSDCYVIHNTGNSKNAEFAAYILEALAYYSSSEYDERTGDNSSLTYAYYETVLKRKNTRDTESLEMLDLIFENRIYDIAIALDLQGIKTTVIRGAVKEGGFASKYASISPYDTGIYHALGRKLKELIVSSDT